MRTVGANEIITRCDLQIRVRYAECDPMGYLHHAKYFEYFEMGRTELLRLSGFSYRDMVSSEKFFVVARSQCKFKKPALYDDVLTLTTMMTCATSARIDHEYELRRDNELLCTAQTTLACVDDSGRLIAIPDHFISD